VRYIDKDGDRARELATGVSHVAESGARDDGIALRWEMIAAVS